jgi:hypothetical protein
MRIAKLAAVARQPFVLARLMLYISRRANLSQRQRLSGDHASPFACAQIATA